MKGDEKSHLIQLCEQAAVEQDGTRLLDLVREINSLLEQKESRPNPSSADEGSKVAPG
jgi:hypothetical protein